MSRIDRRRREELRRFTVRHKDGRFWYRVPDARPYRKGAIVWIDEEEHKGRHEVLLSGYNELLVRPISYWEAWRRLWAGRLRRWRLRLRRRS